MTLKEDYAKYQVKTSQLHWKLLFTNGIQERAKYHLIQVNSDKVEKF